MVPVAVTAVTGSSLRPPSGNGIRAFAGTFSLHGDDFPAAHQLHPVEGGYTHPESEQTMPSQNFTTTILVDQTPEEAFAAILDVRAWWSGNIEGRTDQVGAEFTYRYEDVHYSKQRITELVPAQRVVWRVLDSYLDFTEDPGEWIGTDVTFEVARSGEHTEVRFSHLGLVPEFECFDTCSSAWRFYINGSLRTLITSGHGQPNGKEEPAA